MKKSITLAQRQFDRPVVMGILNVTPDSFSDGGRFTKPELAMAQVESMLEDGADIIDVGGESTRPGAKAVGLDDELARTVPIVEAIKARFDCLVSIDTSKAEVMRQTVAVGADIINDVCALTQPGALDAAAELQIPVCLMHMQGEPRTMQSSPSYQQLIPEVLAFLKQRISACEEVGLQRDKLIIDPGFGFGKTLEHNYQLLAQLSEFHQLGLPVLAGMSRKSMFGQLLDRSADQRLAASLAGAVLAAEQGAQIFRVHDVKETSDALRVFSKVWQYK